MRTKKPRGGVDIFTKTAAAENFQPPVFGLIFLL